MTNNSDKLNPTISYGVEKAYFKRVGLSYDLAEIAVVSTLDNKAYLLTLIERNYQFLHFTPDSKTTLQYLKTPER